MLCDSFHRSFITRATAQRSPIKHATRCPRHYPMEEFAQLAATFGVVARGLTFALNRNGIEYDIHVISGRSSFRFLIEAWWRPELAQDRTLARFARKTRFHLFGELWGLALKQATGDAEFDTTVHMDTYLKPESILSVLNPPGRLAIRQLLSEQWRTVTLSSKTLQVERSPTLDALSHGVVERALQAIEQLVDALLPVKQTLPEKGPRSMVEKMGLPCVGIWVISAYVWMAQDLILHLPGTWPHLTSVAVGIPLALVLTAVVALVRRNTITAMKDIAVCGSLLLVTVPWALSATLPGLNSLLDTSAARRCPSVLLRTVHSARSNGLVFRGINGDSSEFAVPDLFQGRPRIRAPGTPVTLLVRDGFFGWRYLQDVAE